MQGWITFEPHSRREEEKGIMLSINPTYVIEECIALE
jgi:hypothetical protein